MVLVTLIFVKFDSHEQQFFDVLEHTKAIHFLMHMAGWGEQKSNLHPSWFPSWRVKSWLFFVDPMWSWHQAILDFLMDSVMWSSVLSGVFKRAMVRTQWLILAWLALSYLVEWLQFCCIHVNFLVILHHCDFLLLCFNFWRQRCYVQWQILSLPPPDAKPPPWSSSGVFRGGQCHWKGAQRLLNC